ncbi:MAG: hypothetical protein ABFD79_05610, partial [Phycisphaerales bacterium]
RGIIELSSSVGVCSARYARLTNTYSIYETIINHDFCQHTRDWNRNDILEVTLIISKFGFINNGVKRGQLVIVDKKRNLIYYKTFEILYLWII